MGDVKSLLLERRSIRRYERESISAEVLEFIYDAIRNTPTSYNGQQFSVIDIDNQELKEQLYGITNQKQIKTCNHFFVFCADYNKIMRLSEAKGIEFPGFCNTMDGILVGIVDASLAMQNALVAARLLNPAQKQEFVQALQKEQAMLREKNETKQVKLVSLEEAQKNKLKLFD